MGERTFLISQQIERGDGQRADGRRRIHRIPPLKACERRGPLWTVGTRGADMQTRTLCQANTVIENYRIAGFA